MLFDSANDALSAADAADLVIGAGDFTAECWYAGTGAAPAGELVFFIKTGSGQKEFAANWFGGAFNIFASSDGNNWTTNVVFSTPAAFQAVFWNGATRHLALVKSGSTWALYINGEKMQSTISLGTVFNGTGVLSVALGGVAPVGSMDEWRATYGTARYTTEMASLIARKFSRG